MANIEDAEIDDAEFNIPGMNSTMDYVTLQVPGVYEQVMSFLSAVDWSEPWIIGILIFHVSMFILMIRLKDTTMARFALLFFLRMQTMLVLLMMLVLIVRSLEFFNDWAANNWRLFSRQNYFDKSGLFLVIVVALPILLNCALIVVCLMTSITVLLIQVHSLWTTFELVTKLGKARSREQARQRALEAGAETTPQPAVITTNSDDNGATSDSPPPQEAIKKDTKKKDTKKTK